MTLDNFNIIFGKITAKPVLPSAPGTILYRNDRSGNFKNGSHTRMYNDPQDIFTPLFFTFDVTSLPKCLPEPVSWPNLPAPVNI